MPTSKYCLQWDNHSQTLSASLYKLYLNHDFVDLTLICNDDLIKVHKCVLTACSPYFEDFLKDTPDNISLKMRGIEFYVLESLFEFMYTGVINILEEKIPALFEVAKFFKIRGLSGMVSQMIGVKREYKVKMTIEDPIIIYDSSCHETKENSLNIELNTCGTSDVDPIAVHFAQTEFIQENSSLDNDLILKQFELAETITSIVKNDSEDKSVKKYPVKNTSDSVSFLSQIDDKSQKVLVQRLPRINSPSEQSFVSQVIDCVPQDTENINCDLEAVVPNIESSIDLINQNINQNFNESNSELNTEELKKHKDNKKHHSTNKAMHLLEEAGIPTDVPIYCESSDGSYIQLTNEILNEIASGSQVVYQIFDDNGEPSEVMLGNTVFSKTLSPKVQTPILHNQFNDTVQELEKNSAKYNESLNEIESRNDVINEYVLNEETDNVNSNIIIKSPPMNVQNTNDDQIVFDESTICENPLESKTKVKDSEVNDVNSQTKPEQVQSMIESVIDSNNVKTNDCLLPTKSFSAILFENIELKMAELHNEIMTENEPEETEISEKSFKRKIDESSETETTHKKSNMQKYLRLSDRKLKSKNTQIFKSSNCKNGKSSEAAIISEERMKLTLQNNSQSENPCSLKIKKDIPYALGLLPLNKALQKIQSMPDHTPRKTRSSMNTIKVSTDEKMISDSSESDSKVDKNCSDNDSSSRSVQLNSKQLLQERVVKKRRKNAVKTQ